MLMPELRDSQFALYDIDPQRLEESRSILDAMRLKHGGFGSIQCYCGVDQRKEALRDAAFVVCAVAVGGYEATCKDFDIPNRYGLGQVIGDTVGIGGIMRALRTIPVMEDFARDMQEVCPNALLMNYSNPMAMLTGYLQTYTDVETVGLCHSVQVCSKLLLTRLGMEDKLDGRRERIAGINHMAWLLELRDKDGNDLYPEVRRRVQAGEYIPNSNDLVRLDYIRNFGYYCTESSLHHAEYSPFYIKRNYPERLERFGIHLDEYPARCRRQIAAWKEEYASLRAEGVDEHLMSREYGAKIIRAIVTNEPLQIGGNVLNTGRHITNLPEEACVEVPCLVNGTGIHPCHVGKLPTICAAMNQSNINTQLLTMDAARAKKRDLVYQAAMMDPHTGAELDVDSIRAMVDDLLLAHGLDDYQ